MNATDDTRFETPPDPDEMIRDEPVPGSSLTTDPEAPEADAWDQALEVPYDEDDERP